MALQNAAAIVVMDLKKQRQRTITIDSNCGIQFLKEDINVMKWMWIMGQSVFTI